MQEHQGIPDIYADQIGILITDWGMMLTLNGILPPALPPEPQETFRENVQLPAELRGILRLSHAHAKTVTILLKRVIKMYEERSGVIQIPQQMIDRHQITPEDWA